MSIALGLTAATCFAFSLAADLLDEIQHAHVQLEHLQLETKDDEIPHTPCGLHLCRRVVHRVCKAGALAPELGRSELLEGGGAAGRDG